VVPAYAAIENRENDVIAQDWGARDMIDEQDSQPQGLLLLGRISALPK